jgi:hypothetical protein
MKRFLCLAIALTFGLATFAQRSSYIKLDHPKVNQSVEATFVKPFDPVVEATDFAPPANMVQVQTSKSGMSFSETHVWTTQYDLQTNAALGNRVYAWPDGTVAATATWGMTGAPGFPDRGSAYNYYDGSSWGALPTARIEPVRSGWPSIAPLGANGEVVVSHGGTPFGINVYTRETKGTGAWTATSLPNPAPHELTWPRVVTSGADNNTIHVVATDQLGNDPIFYNKSSDAGANWDGWIPMPALDSEFYNWIHAADDYVFARNGDVLALAFFSAWYDIFFLKSTDGGETWEHHVAWEHPYPTFSWETTLTTDTLYTNDNSGHIAIDNDGIVHLVWGVSRVAHWEPGTTYNYWPYTQGVGYWNETMGQIPTHPTNPHHTLNPNNLLSMGMLVGWVPDETGSGQLDIFDLDLMTYRALGLTNSPTIAIDEIGTIVVAFSTVSETRDNGEFYYRSIYTSYKDGIYGTWYINEDNLMDNFIHLFDEGIYPTAAAQAYDNTFWLIYNADNAPGTALDDDHGYHDNQMYAVKITPTIVGINEFANPISNISSAYPNPVTGTHFNVDINLSRTSKSAQVTVHNIAGQMVHQQNLGTLSIGMNRVQVDVTGYQSGIYFYTVIVDDYKETKKVIVR